MEKPLYSVAFFLGHTYNILWHKCTDGMGASLGTLIANEIIDKIQNTTKFPYRLFMMYFDKKESLMRECTLSVVHIETNEPKESYAQDILHDVVNTLLEKIKKKDDIKIPA